MTRNECDWNNGCDSVIIIVVISACLTLLSIIIGFTQWGIDFIKGKRGLTKDQLFEYEIKFKGNFTIQSKKIRNSHKRSFKRIESSLKEVFESCDEERNWVGVPDVNYEFEVYCIEFKGQLHQLSVFFELLVYTQKSNLVVIQNEMTQVLINLCTAKQSICNQFERSLVLKLELPANIKVKVDYASKLHVVRHKIQRGKGRGTVTIAHSASKQDVIAASASSINYGMVLNSNSPSAGNSVNQKSFGQMVNDSQNVLPESPTPGDGVTGVTGAPDSDNDNDIRMEPDFTIPKPIVMPKFEGNETGFGGGDVGGRTDTMMSMSSDGDVEGINTRAKRSTTVNSEGHGETTTKNLSIDEQINEPKDERNGAGSVAKQEKEIKVEDLSSKKKQNDPKEYLD